MYEWRKNGNKSTSVDPRFRMRNHDDYVISKNPDSRVERQKSRVTNRSE